MQDSWVWGGVQKVDSCAEDGQRAAQGVMVRLKQRGFAPEPLCVSFVSLGGICVSWPH